MSTSTDAILMYGVALQEGALPDVNHDDYDALPADHPERLRYMGDTANGISIEAHCSGSCTEYVVGYGASRTCASRGYPEVIADVGARDPAPLLAYCEKWGLKIDKSVSGGAPAWLLFSWWG